MNTEILSFASGVILTLGGGFLTYLFQKRFDKIKEKEKLRFEIYMNLLDINSNYFWVSSAEMRKEKVSPEITRLLRELSLKTSDNMRQVDDIEYLDETLDILFSEKYQTAIERAQKLDELLDKIQNIVNPKFSKKMKQISGDNVRITANKSLSELNAPGTWKGL